MRLGSLLRALGRRTHVRFSAILVPLAILPLLAAVPMIRSEYESFAASFLPREPLPAPAVALTAAEHAQFKPLPEYDGAVPVLAYHGINDRNDHYSVSRESFARQMAMLARARFRTISLSQYERFLRGDRAGLPLRPILITFDGARNDSFQGADAILERHGMRATMFVPAAQIGDEPFHSRWEELRAMRDSGRWDLGLQAGEGASTIPVDGRGTKGAYYANLKVEGGARETFTAYQRRVTGDVLLGRRLMAEHLPGWRPQVMAVLFGDLGQTTSNDPRIAPFLRDWLHGQFSTLFAEGQPVYSTPKDLGGVVNRYQMRTRTTPDALYRWLRHGLSGSWWTAEERRLGEEAMRRREAAEAAASGARTRAHTTTKTSTRSGSRSK